MLFFTHNLVAQKIDFNKWSQFIEVLELKNYKPKNTFFLVTAKKGFSKNSLEKEDSICRVLDANNFILKSTQENIIAYNKIDYNPANNLWKLGPLHPVNNLDYFFNIKTSEPLLLKEKLIQIGVQNIIVNEYSINVQTNWSIIHKEILPLDYVTYVGSECLKPVHESIVKDLDLSINGIFKAIQLYPELNGSSQTIGLKDNLPNTDDIDLLNKIKSSSVASTITDNHATDMATIISGRGNSGTKGFGVLSGASIFPMDFNNLFPDDSQILDEANVTLINNSYGTTIENFYGVLAGVYDQFMYDNPTKLHIFSSGNSGSLVAQDGAYQDITGYGNLTGNFKMAKNCITVGAIDQDNNVLSFSSKGPAYDGRVKPEIVAYSILGTSNATALVTGVMGVLQQAYLQKENRLPSAAALKAILLNGADDVGRPGIDFETGYGNLNAVESLNIINNDNYITDTIQSNETKIFNIDVPEDVVDFKAMLVWTDVPALPNDNLALKNDLDITINDGNTIFLPSILNTTPTLDSIEEEAIRGIDTLNPVEQVVISAPESRSYIISVKANNLETIDQEFSLVYTWKSKDNFEWVYPIMNADFPYNNGGVGGIKWESSFEENKLADLEISFDNSETWELISEDVNLSSGLYNWVLPVGLHSKARLRFVTDNSIEISDEFNISTGLSINTSLNCDDITEINWNKKENTSEYRIYNLQNNEMELISTVTDTSFVFSKMEFPNPYFSIAPLLDNNIETLRSDTVNTLEFSENCYFDFVFASLMDSTVNIEVSISSMYDLKSIEGFRINEDNSLSQISLTEELDSFLFNITDNSPSDGDNRYQFKVTTNSGEEYLSQETSIRYFSRQNPFLVFPNPTTLEKGITVFSGLPPDQMATFEFYDIYGHLIFATRLSSDVSFVPLNLTNITKGVYICKIVGSAVFSQKIVIQ